MICNLANQWHANWEDSWAYHRVFSADTHTVDGLHNDKHEEEAIDGGAVRGCQEHSACM